MKEVERGAQVMKPFNASISTLNERPQIGNGTSSTAENESEHDESKNVKMIRERSGVPEGYECILESSDHDKRVKTLSTANFRINCGWNGRVM
jgi:hypothetical protein